jgi:hypothetical protein
LEYSKFPFFCVLVILPLPPPYSLLLTTYCPPSSVLCRLSSVLLALHSFLTSKALATEVSVVGCFPASRPPSVLANSPSSCFPYFPLFVILLLSSVLSLLSSYPGPGRVCRALQRSGNYFSIIGYFSANSIYILSPKLT